VGGVIFSSSQRLPAAANHLVLQLHHQQEGLLMPQHQYSSRFGQGMSDDEYLIETA
jgi:hypothetical protein